MTNPDKPNDTKPIEAEDRFWSNVQKTDGCWLWQGGLSSGYGMCWYNKSMQFSHRVAYRLLVGEIPEGLELDHLCRVRRCVNPAHLEAVTHAENIQRGIPGQPRTFYEDIPTKNPRKTVCKVGHPLSGDNLYIRADKTRARNCRACHREAVRRFYARERAKRAELMIKGAKDGS